MTDAWPGSPEWNRHVERFASAVFEGFDKRKQEGRNRPCYRCGATMDTSVEILVRAAIRKGRPRNQPAQRGARSRTFCEPCAEIVWDVLTATLLNAALPVDSPESVTSNEAGGE